MKNTLIVIPTYNEVDNIKAIICELLAIDESYHVVVVDDPHPMEQALWSMDLSLNILGVSF